jgi:pimeloyl-ACP methyl ester carboxylesterase
MQKVIPCLLMCGFMALVADCQPALAQKKKTKKGKFAPPGSLTPSAEVMKQIAAKTDQLADKIAELRKNPKHHALLPDVEIYLRGAKNIVRFKEFYNKNSGQWTLNALDEGLRRADQLSQGATPWTTLARSNVLRAYRSQIDGTAQPYGVTYPNGYGKDVDKKWRVDIVLHGRNSTLTEVSFLNQHNGTKKPMPGQDWVQIDIFGRGNNAYRWAGETDVFEAMEAFFANEAKMGRRDLPDRRKVVLRGFSMGGAGTWHLGLHRPDRWCVMGPGAGFTTTHGYAWKGTKELPDYQEKCLRIYDAIDYVENARMIPIVAYSGGKDAQKLAADNIENRLKELKIDAMTHIVAPGLGHTFPPEWFKKANAIWGEHAGKDRPAFSGNPIHFVTYTAKFGDAREILVQGLERHYEKTVVDAHRTDKGWTITTRNVRAFSLFTNGSMNHRLDNQEIKTPADKAFINFLKDSGKWRPVSSKESLEWLTSGRHKSSWLHGPIDDAFTHAFTCVLGSGDTWHPATQKFVDAKVKAFKYDWAKHWRGELPTIGDYAVTPNEIMNKNLILFGDPSSNLTLAQILPKLPLKWTKDTIEFGGKKYKASEHVPVMIFPNPLNPRKYVVLNTGMTIPSEDYVKTNALLYPRLGDYAILRMTGGSGFEVAMAGLFDEFWKVK